jgi:hypothetical protein
MSDRASSWQKVVQDDPLLIYEFEPTNLIALSRMSRVSRYSSPVDVALNHTYTLHTFDTSCPDMSIIGEASPMLILPPLHGYSVTLSDHVSGEPLPPQGVFDWHYMRCAISHFAMQGVS